LLFPWPKVDRLDRLKRLIDTELNPLQKRGRTAFSHYVASRQGINPSTFDMCDIQYCEHGPVVLKSCAARSAPHGHKVVSLLDPISSRDRESAENYAASDATSGKHEERWYKVASRGLIVNRTKAVSKQLIAATWCIVQLLSGPLVISKVGK